MSTPVPPPGTVVGTYENLTLAFIAAIRAVAATGARVTITLAPGEATGVADDIERLVAERDALREAAGALVEALRVGCPKTCEHAHCSAMATRFMQWRGTGFGEDVCDDHVEEFRAENGGEEPELDDQEFYVAAPLRALRALLGGDR